MHMDRTIAVWMPKSMQSRVLTRDSLDRLAGLGRIVSAEEEELTKAESVALLRHADAVITCWGSLALDEELLEAASRLRLVAHAAGSVKWLCPDSPGGVWERGIHVTSAAAANARSVAEHTLGMMIALLKRSFWLSERLHAGEAWRAEYDRSKAMYRITIGIVGAGHIGRLVMQLLKPFQVSILLYDPTLTAEETEQLGAVKADSMDQLMAESDVVSLHAPELPSTRHMVHAGNLKLMKDNTLLINTARGSLIDEAALIAELKEGRITAYLDVTENEPLPEDCLLRGTPNLILTPHNAGALFNDTFRMGDLAVTEVERFFKGEPALYPVRRESLHFMA